MIALRPFPGIAFRVETPVATDLPRMDIGAFVGLAERGPLHTPVPVETYPDFVDIFGDIYQLAWDGEEGIWQTACLAAAVRSFFALGGRRCWIVRVSSDLAISTTFPLAGLLQTTLSGYQGVEAVARSVGSWADDLRVRVELQLLAVGFAPLAVIPNQPVTLDLMPQQGQTLEAGDLLQLDFDDRIHRAYGIPTVEGRRWAIAQPHWFRRIVTQASTSLAGTVTLITPTASISASTDLRLDDLTLVIALASQTGDWLRFETATDRGWLLVDSVTEVDNPSQPDSPNFRLTLEAAWWENGSTLAGELPLVRVQRVRLALRVEGEGSISLDNLTASASHPRFIGDLPTDEVLFAPSIGLTEQPPISALGATVKSPRFPLSLSLPDGAITLPLGIEEVGIWRGGHIPSGDRLERDGLIPAVSDLEALNGIDWANFLPELYLDLYLRFVGARSLLNEAHDRLYLQGQRLRGIYSLIPIEEVSAIALPDAAHRGWYFTPREIVFSPSLQPTEPPVDPWAKDSPFVPCQAPPTDPVSPSETPLPTLTQRLQWQLLPPSDYEARGLLTLQQAIANLAVARADWVGILDLPKHYRLSEALDHQQQLLSLLRRDDNRADSYVALYHPWLISRLETGELIHSSPTGAIAGIMAARSLSRGAWVAPANEVIPDILATIPSLGLIEQNALYTAQINPIRQEARGFVPWGSDTLSADLEVQALNVRRLLILLRRLALREGQTFVFAPQSAAFQRRVKQQFERVLSRLFDRGAFAGRVLEEGFRVTIADETTNRNAISNGQLIVELRVAPSRPLTFITVRLIQQDSPLLVVQEVSSNGR
jgi:hypothetical protein